jgi:RNA recognition motif-containing protein
MFAEVGEVEDAVIISYKDTGRSKGFGFVTMKEDAGADEAIKKFNGFEIEGRALIVDKARPMREDGEGGGEAPASGEAPAAEKTPAA